MIVAIQLALFSLTMAHNPVTESNYQDGWWYHVVSARNPSTLASTTPCLLQSPPVIRRDSYRYTPGIGGHRLHTRAVLWNEARLICEEEGGHLAIINSNAEAKAIIELFKISESITGSEFSNLASIGFHDFYSEGQYTTIHGQSLAKAGYTLWQYGQPNNNRSGRPENCGSITSTGELNDIDCGVKLGFICEMPIY